MPSKYDGRGNRDEGAYKLYSFGEYIRKLRKEKGWTQKQVAERMGLPTSQKVCDMEAGRKFSRRINIELLQRVAAAFDVPIAEVFASVQSTLQVAQTADEVIVELVPLVNFTQQLAENLQLTAGTYTLELEEMAKRVNANLKKIQLLSKLLHRNTIKSTEVFKEE